MKARPVKTYIEILIKRHGGHKKLAEKLDIALSYVYQLQKGAVPGKRLYRDIKELYKFGN